MDYILGHSINFHKLSEKINLETISVNIKHVYFL